MSQLPRLALRHLHRGSWLAETIVDDATAWVRRGAAREPAIGSKGVLMVGDVETGPHHLNISLVERLGDGR